MKKIIIYSIIAVIVYSAIGMTIKNAILKKAVEYWNGGQCKICGEDYEIINDYKRNGVNYIMYSCPNGDVEFQCMPKKYLKKH